jgi:hypothetical protein
VQCGCGSLLPHGNNILLRFLQSAQIHYRYQLCTGECRFRRHAGRRINIEIVGAFPAERGGPSRRIPTCYAAAPLNRLIAHGDDPIPVWPYSKGESRGIALAPLYKLVPIAALRDPLLYQQLSSLSLIREGRASERKSAEQELTKTLHSGSDG